MKDPRHTNVDRQHSLQGPLWHQAAHPPACIDVLRKCWIATFIFALLLFSDIRAAEFAPLFNNGAVLQADLPVNVWGRAEPGVEVAVTFAGQEKTTVSDRSGLWQVQLDALAPSTEPRSLTASSGEQKSVIGNVVVGEVWIASGQSNMVWPLEKTEGGPASLTQRIPQIRFVIVPRQVGLPARPMTAEQLKWKSFEPDANGEIAAVAFYFAEHLQTHLGGAIGIIQSSVNGTPAQAWTPLAALEAEPELKHHADHIEAGLASAKPDELWIQEAEKYENFRSAQQARRRNEKEPAPELAPPLSPGNPWFRNSPTVLYENMIAPLVPYTARGVIWYQGESNAAKPVEYRTLFPGLIGAWRRAWERPDLPFLFAQLAAYEDPQEGRDFPGLRDAQRSTRDSVPNTGMAVTIDVGERNDIHPKFKKPVGERLARLALAQVYGQEVVARGPVMTKAEAEGSAITVTFDHIGDGLTTSDTQKMVPGFEVAGRDGKFHAVTARLAGPSAVALEVAADSEAIAVRYASLPWIEPPVTLQNSAKLPAEPGEIKVIGVD